MKHTCILALALVTSLTHAADTSITFVTPDGRLCMQPATIEQGSNVIVVPLPPLCSAPRAAQTARVASAPVASWVDFLPKPKK